MDKMDCKSKNIIRKLNKSIHKQRQVSQDIEIFGAGDTFESYFNKKMKTFYLNEKRQLDYKLQKIDYIINKA